MPRAPILETARLLGAFILLPTVVTRLAAQAILPSSTVTVHLQTNGPDQSSFLLPTGNLISAAGYAVVGDHSQNWHFINQGNILAGSGTVGGGLQLGSLTEAPINCC